MNIKANHKMRNLSAVMLIAAGFLFPNLVFANDPSTVGLPWWNYWLSVFANSVPYILLIALLLVLYFIIFSFAKKTAQMKSRASLFIVELLVLTPFALVFLVLFFDIIHPLDLSWWTYTNPIFAVVLFVVLSILVSCIEMAICQSILKLQRTFRLLLPLNLAMGVMFLLALFATAY